MLSSVVTGVAPGRCQFGIEQELCFLLIKQGQEASKTGRRTSDLFRLAEKPYLAAIEASSRQPGKKTFEF